MVYVLVCGVALIVLFNVSLIGYCKRSAVWKMGILPGQLFIYDKFLKGKYFSVSKVKQHRQLLGEEIDEEKLRYVYGKRLTLANMIILAVCITGIIVNDTGVDGSIYEKPEYYDGSQNVEVVVDVDNTEGIISDEEKEIIKENLSITIEPSRITKEEFDELVNDVINYIYSELPGDNKSLDEVKTSLKFVEHYPDNDEVSIVWVPDEEGYIDSQGNIDEIPKEKDVVVEILAIISCQGYETTVPINVCVVKRDLSGMELLREFINSSVEEQNKDMGNDTIELPKEMGGIKLSYPIKKDYSTQIVLIIMGIMGAIIIVFGKDYENEKRATKIKEGIAREYSNIVSKMVILMKSGMSVTNAWKRIAYEKAGWVREEVVYDMMKLSVREMESGITTYESFRNFGIRIGSEPFIRLVTYINQNMSKGTGEILNILELEMLKSCEERKNMILRAGEKASTKMVFPMVMLLMMVMVITVIPALMMM